MDQHDNVRVLQQQRKDAREEIERIQRWIAAQEVGAFGRLSTLNALQSKLDRVRDVILRADA